MAHSPAQKIAVQKVDHRKARPAPKKKARQASIDLDAAMAACHGYESFSRSVLLGLQKQGFGLKDTARITGLSQARLELVLKEKAILEDAVILAIEKAVGLDAGQLAILSFDNPDPELVAIINALAGLGEP